LSAKHLAASRISVYAMCKMKESTRGKRKMGRPVTTGSDSTPPVQFRISAADRQRLEREAAAAGVTVGQLARARTLGTRASR
jgi:hypothetical protein